MPTEQLLVFLVSEPTSETIDAVRSLGATFQRGRWTLGPPAFVDETDASSCSQPEDEPIRTVGFVLEVTPTRVDGPSTPAAEVERFLQPFAQLRVSDANLEFEVEYRGIYVGTIAAGKLDRSLVDGLLKPWDNGSTTGQP